MSKQKSTIYTLEDLQQADERCQDIVAGMGFEVVETVFHLCRAEEIYDIAARGLPGRYSHYHFGKLYEQQKGKYDRGLGRIYELIINTKPVHAYLLEGNSLLAQTLVMGHCYGHSFAYRTNRYFEPADSGILPRVASAAERINAYMGQYGRKVVEEFIDDCEAMFFQMSLDQMGSQPAAVEPVWEEKDYDRLYPEETADRRKEFEAEREEFRTRFPKQPEREILGFIATHARQLEDWQRDVISIVRTEMTYFVPNARTKVLHEGFATYFHNRVMHEMDLNADDFFEFQAMNAVVLAPHPIHPNPYLLGSTILSEVERLCTDPDDEEREIWPWAGDTDPHEKLIEIARNYDDVSLLNEFVTAKVCEKAKLFAWDPQGDKNIRISSRDAEEIRHRLVAAHTNVGIPVVEIIDADGKGEGELWLRHNHNGVGLDDEYTRGVLKHLFNLWGKPVQVESISGDQPDKPRWWKISNRGGLVASFSTIPK
jgi:stage V sporulation protein R